MLVYSLKQKRRKEWIEVEAVKMSNSSVMDRSLSRLMSNENSTISQGLNIILASLCLSKVGMVPLFRKLEND